MKPASDLDRGHDGRRYILFVHQFDSRSDRTMAQLGVGQRVRSKRSASSLLGLRPSPGVNLPKHLLSIRITLGPPNAAKHTSLRSRCSKPGAYAGPKGIVCGQSAMIRRTRRPHSAGRA
jgi:hypothetical protein